MMADLIMRDGVPSRFCQQVSLPCPWLLAGSRERDESKWYACRPNQGRIVRSLVDLRFLWLPCARAVCPAATERMAGSRRRPPSPGSARLGGAVPAAVSVPGLQPWLSRGAEAPGCSAAV